MRIVVVALIAAAACRHSPHHRSAAAPRDAANAGARAANAGTRASSAGGTPAAEAPRDAENATAANAAARPRLSPMGRVQLAKLLLLAYARDAYPRWLAAHRGKRCPASLAELAAHLAVAPDIPTRTDPWGHPLWLRCLATGIAIGSAGPDGVRGTADDLTTRARFGAARRGGH